LSGVKCHFRTSEEKRRLSRRFAPMPRQDCRDAVLAVTSVKFGVLFGLHEIELCTWSYKFHLTVTSMKNIGSLISLRKYEKFEGMGKWEREEWP